MQHKNLSTRSTERRAATGEIFTFSEDNWTLSKTADVSHFKFDWCRSVTSAELKGVIKELIAQRLETEQPGTVYAGYSHLKHLLKNSREGKSSRISTITKQMVLRYLANNPDYYHEPLKIIGRKWMKFKLSGMTTEAAEILASIPSSRRRTDHITTLNPLSGPYIDEEIYLTDQALHHAFERGKINASQFSLVQVFRLYGPRAAMVANMKVQDIMLPRYHDVNKGELRFERTKSRNKHGRRIGPWRPMPMLLTAAMEEHVGALLRGNSLKDSYHLPLFPASFREFSIKLPNKKWYSSTEQTIKGYQGHARAPTIRMRFQLILNSLNIISPRTREPIVFNQLRERHTVATLMALRGCNADEIGAWLQHETASACEAYIEVAARHHQSMSSILDGRFTHLAGRFLGKISRGEEAHRTDSASIFAMDIEGAPEIGGCAAGGCPAIASFSAPFACFLCDKFHLMETADIDPLIEILIERKRLSEEHGDDEYARSLNRHLAALMAGMRAQQDFKDTQQIGIERD